MSYKDQIWCPFYRQCSKRIECKKALTDTVKDEIKNLQNNGLIPVSIYVEYPDCYVSVEENNKSDDEWLQNIHNSHNEYMNAMDKAIKIIKEADEDHTLYETLMASLKEAIEHAKTNKRLREKYLYDGFIHE